MPDDRRRKFFSGRSVEQALVAAASYHGIDPSEIEYREIEKRHGFVRTRRNAVIAVDPDHPRKAVTAAPAAARPAPAAPPAPAGGEESRREERPTRPREERPARSREERPRRQREDRPARPRQEAAPEVEAAPEPVAPEAAERGGEQEGRRPERPRRERRGRGRGRGGSGEPRQERPAASRAAKKPSESAAPTPPWWLAEPVEEDTHYGVEDLDEELDETEELDEMEAFDEPEEDEDGEVEDDEIEDDEGEAGSEGPEESGPESDDRFRHVRRSEGLRRRTPPGPPGPPAAAPRSEEGPRREGRGGGRRRRGGRGRGPEAAGELRQRSGSRREPAAPEAPPPAPPEPRIPRSERLPREEGELADAAREALERLLEFVGVEAEADFYRDGERLEIELWGPDDQILLDDEGQLLLAIEHLLPRMIRGIYGDALPVRVDCADFHADREDRLRDLARRTADEVRRRGRPRTLEEMDPAERRIVHITLEDDPTVATESIGDGYFKKLKVMPA